MKVYCRVWYTCIDYRCIAAWFSRVSGIDRLDSTPLYRQIVSQFCFADGKQNWETKLRTKRYRVPPQLWILFFTLRGFPVAISTHFNSCVTSAFVPEALWYVSKLFLPIFTFSRSHACSTRTRGSLHVITIKEFAKYQLA